jgi:hypothetical protein
MHFLLLTHRAIPALGVGVVLNNGRITALEIFLLGRLNCHLVLCHEAPVALHRRSLGVCGRASAAVDHALSGRHCEVFLCCDDSRSGLLGGSLMLIKVVARYSMINVIK